MIVIVHTGQLLHICLDSFKGSVIGNKYLFLDCIEHTVIIIYLNANFSLMTASVHIAINQKLNIFRLIHTQNFHIMSLIQCPSVRIVLIIKAEQTGKFIICCIITIQPVFVDKRQHIPPIALCHFHFFTNNTKHDFIVSKGIF